MFSRIVVGTDGSDTAAEAVRQAIELARMAGSTLSIVSAYEPVSGRRLKGEQEGVPADVSHEIGPREDVNLVLEAAVAEAKRSGVEAEMRPVEGDPSEAILTVAEDSNADLVIVGNKGMTGARRFLLGSVPNNISHHAPCSVLIAHTT